MQKLTTEALVLRAVDLGESDRVVQLLTPETGRIAAIAKGARRSVRRFPGTLDLDEQYLGSLRRLRARATTGSLAPVSEVAARQRQLSELPDAERLRFQYGKQAHPDSSPHP